MSTTPAINLCHGSALSLITAINLSQIYCWHRWTIIAGDSKTSNKFIAGINDTGEQWSAGDKDTGDNIFPGINDTGEQLSSVITTLVINLSPVSTIPVNKKASETLTLANNLSPVSLVHRCHWYRWKVVHLSRWHRRWGVAKQALT